MAAWVTSRCPLVLILKNSTVIQQLCKPAISITTWHKVSLSSFSKVPLLPSISDPRLLDPDLMEDRTSFATAHTTRRADFRQRVHDRDGICILSGTAEDVQACHIVPHSKGNQVCSQY